MALTRRQEAFCQALADGQNQSDAYRVAYSAARMKAETVQNSAYKLLKNGEVSARVRSLKHELASIALWTREDSVRELADIARGAGAKAAEKVAAIKELNLMHGFNAPTEIKHSGSVISRIERVVIDPKP